MIGLDGTPGCRLNRLIDDSVYVEAGVRHVTTDRAGYGRSSRHRGRSVADEAWDVLAVADALGFDRFAVVGSGGEPHALACSALLGAASSGWRASPRWRRWASLGWPGTSGSPAWIPRLPPS